MCGICGFVAPRQPELLRGMTWDLRRRGPDGVGYFEDDAVSLGHRRLSIIDLETGDQPITDPESGATIVYNGELYNYRELRRELEGLGRAFQTSSDTEVLLAAFLQWGQGALRRLDGIFAFAVWEPRHQRLTLARDPFGVKPLRYRYLRRAKQLYFSSETRSLFRTPEFDRTPRAAALDSLLTLRYELGGDVFEEVEQVPPGHALVFEGGKPRVERYWAPRPYRESRSAKDDAARYRELFDAAVERQLVADVPLGFFLSGGLDSSAIVDAASRAGADLHAFSIGFGTDGDELDKARGVAQHYGATHHTVLLRPSEFLAELPKTFASFDEPVLDAIQVATYVLSREAVKHVKVVLTGEGADETLAGYVHHRALSVAGGLRKVVPDRLTGLMGGLVERFPLQALERVFPYPEALGASGRRKLARLLEQLPSAAKTYLEAASLLSRQDGARAFTTDFITRIGQSPLLLERIEERFKSPELPSTPTEQVMWFDFGGWLPNNILTKLDRLTMAHGLEGRVPFLDVALAEHALGSSLKSPPHETKTLLRRAMLGRLPQAINKQAKHAFYLPVERSLGQPYEALARDLLSPEAVAGRGLLRPDYVSRLLDQGGQRELVDSKRLFTLVALELWMREVVDPEPPQPPAEVLQVPPAGASA